MNIGSLRHRVALQSYAETQNATTGVLTSGWTEVAQVWAAIEPLSAREFVAAQAAQSEVTTNIRIRYRAGVTASMRIVHGSAKYNITGVIPDNRSGREWLTLQCTVGTGEGGA